MRTRKCEDCDELWFDCVCPSGHGADRTGRVVILSSGNERPGTETRGASVVRSPESAEGRINRFLVTMQHRALLNGGRV